MQISQPSPESTERSGRPVRPGDDVRVRGIRWRVVDIDAYDSCRVVTLAALGENDGGIQRRVVEPFDCLDRTDRTARPRVVGGRAWRSACRALIATDAPAVSLASARRARMTLMPHQLEPALALLSGCGTRLLLADDVGLGKTVEAGLIVSELRARRWIERVLVLSPAGLRDQWRDELHGRFDLDAVHVDAPTLRRIAGGLPIGFNPWTTIPLAIASVDYVKRAEVLPAVCACRWDMLIVDEAHGVVGDSDRHDAVRELARRAAYVILLTATPHNGDEAAYEALQRLGSIGDDPLLVFRRTRAAIRHQPERRVHTVRVRLTALERRIHAALARYGEAAAAESDSAALAMSVLHKRAYSSAWALLQSVNRRLAALVAASDAGAEQLALPLGDGGGELSPADEAPEWPQELALADSNRERHLLAAVAAACSAAIPAESKIAALARLLRRANESAIVFTEYRDTLVHLQRRLPSVRVVLLHGGMNREERADVLRTFSRRGAPTVLLTTDAAGEGLNLHHACRLVVNLELPWNPMRLEQRIGRVDRIGQMQRVHVVHLVARGTGESRILARLETRVSRARRAVGAPNPLGREAAGADRPNGATTQFTQLAIAETERLRIARAFTSHHHDSPIAVLDSGGTWIATAADLRRLRAALSGKATLIYRVSIVNPYGRDLASRLLALLVDGVPRVRRHRDMKRIMGDIAQACAADLETITDPWRRHAVATIAASQATRIARERAIAAHLQSASSAPVQAGLFDRRAERRHESDHAASTEAQQEAAERVAAVERSAPARDVVHYLSLVVLP